jgi:predicted transcriptional regulator
MSKLLTRISIKPRKVMKRELTIDMRVVKNHGATAAVVLAVVQNSIGRVSTTQVATDVGCTFPTAQKNLRLLVDDQLIRTDGKVYWKI